MTALPRHLQTWAESLAIFPEDIQLIVGEWAARLSGLFRGWPAESERHGEPDGYDGLERRGTYDRLLATEWVLHDVVPEEFLRRVIASEHAFLKRAYRSQPFDRRIVVLLDEGVEQLGAPRIAQLALLVVLSRRAELSSARLEWGLLQDPGVRLHDEVTRSTLLRLLEGRSDRKASVADVDRWWSIRGIESASEVWVAGGARLMEQCARRPVSRIAIDERLEPGAWPELSIRVDVAGGGQQRMVTVALPPPRIAGRILRDPFSPPPPPPTPAPKDSPSEFGAKSALLYGMDGRRLYVRDDEGALVSITVPNSPRGTRAVPGVVRPPPGHVVRAVGWAPGRRRTVLVTTSAELLGVHVLSKRGGHINQTRLCRYPSDLPFDPNADAPIVPLLSSHGAECVAFVAGGHLMLAESSVLISLDAADVSSSEIGFGRMAYRRADDGSLRMAHFEGTKLMRSQPNSPHRPAFGPIGARSFGGLLRNATITQVAGDRWASMLGSQRVEISTPPGFEVFGAGTELSVDHERPEQPYLLALDGSRSRVLQIRPGDKVGTVLLSTPAPVVKAAFEPQRSFAVITEDGRLSVYGLSAEAVVFSLESGSSP